MNDWREQVKQKKNGAKDMEQTLIHQQLLNREAMNTHFPYEREMEFYRCVQAGDVKRVHTLMKPLAGDGFGSLSKDPLRNLKYHLIITIAMISRFCVEGGMEKETAYNISDIFINRADLCNSEKEIKALHWEIILYYTNKMKQLRKQNLYSKPVIQSLDYIYDHLHEKITLTGIAAHLSLTPQYFSRLFRKETGVTLTEYIMRKRIEVAQNMLKFSQYSAVEISNYLSFSSHSHFIHKFRQYTGMTPKAYQALYCSQKSFVQDK